MKGLLLIYVVTALAAVIALGRPRIGVYVYVGFAVLRPQFIWGWAGDLDRVSFVVGLALLIGWALNGFGSWRIGRGRSVVIALCAFAGWSALSATQAADPSIALGAVVELAKILLPFLVGVTMFEGDRQWRPLLWTIVLAQGYVGLEMNMSYLKGSNTASLGFGGMDNNCFGVSLVTVVGLAVTLGLSAKKWYQRVLAGGAAALILHTVLLTYSRGALLGLLAVGITAVWIMPKRASYIGALLVIALLAVRFSGPELVGRYSTVLVSANDRDSSSESRIDLWKDCLKVVEQAPVFGVGPWNWKVVASSFGWPEGKSAHSVWMETAAETGIPGVLALMAFFGAAIVILWPVARGHGADRGLEERLLAAGVITSIAGFAVSGQFVTVTGLEVPYYVVMLGVAMLRTPPSAAVPVVASKIDMPVFGHRRPSVAAMHAVQPRSIPNRAGRVRARF
jgi:O-antigen ligase